METSKYPEKLKSSQSSSTAKALHVEGLSEEQAVEFMAMNIRLHEEVAGRKRIETSLRQLRKAVEMMQLGVVVTDLDGTIVYANQAEADIYGYGPKELLGQNVKILTPPDLQKPLTIEQIQAWKGLIREYFHIRKDGTIFPVRLMSEIVKSSEEEPCAIVTSSEDITERKHAEEELRKHHERLEHMVAERTLDLTAMNQQLRQEVLEHKRTTEALRKSEEKYRIVLETVPDPVVVYNTDGSVAYFNPSFSRVFGWTIKESLGQKIDFIPFEKLIESVWILTKMKRGGTVSNLETFRLAKDGRPLNVSMSGSGFFDSQGTFQGSVITLQDITERKKTEEEMKFLAYHDVLTGLPNRKSFYMRLEDKLVQSRSQEEEKRRASQNSWAVLFLDLDRFKDVNDTLGHDVGDDLLQLVSLRLQLCVRKSDYIFRIGGDEFTVILNNLTNDVDVVRVAQKIRQEISQVCSVKGHEIYVTVSIGISIYPLDGQDAETLVKNADMAMYAAKEKRQGYRIFSEEMNEKAVERVSLESKLHNALQHNQFAVYYQPVANHENRIIGMEALLRWNHPEMGIVSPSKFIPLAEETGSIVSIGKWVLHAACQQVRKWHDIGYADVCVAVNLSTRQFKEPGLIETVEQVLEETGLSPACLKLEVTESGIMESPEQAIAKMNILRAKGIHFSIDDFGTGYSSLSYLKRFPIDILKIDRSFVMDSITDKDDQEIIKTIIAMARNLNLNTVAEGVETREQQQFLTQHGCQMMQGFYFGRPMPADQFEQMLHSSYHLPA